MGIRKQSDVEQGAIVLSSEACSVSIITTNPQGIVPITGCGQQEVKLTLWKRTVEFVFRTVQKVLMFCVE